MKDKNKIIKILEKVFDDDQKYRSDFVSFVNKFGQDSDEVKKLTKKVAEIDSKNLKIVKGILDQYGWLSSNIIGLKANSALFLVIQHSDIDVQKKYYPIMKKTTEEGNASKAQLALLEDRIEIYEGRKQIYGSQIGYDDITKKYYVYPIINPNEVNKRRQEVGLDTIEKYISKWNLIWKEERENMKY